MQHWLWSVTKENWEIVKSRRVWATYNRKVCKIVQRGDAIIFYVKNTLCFKGIFQVSSDWYSTTEIIWDDEIKENKKKYSYQVDIQLIQLGEVDYRDLVLKLKFIEKKHNPRGYLMGMKGGPANYMKPLEESDYKLLYEEIGKKPTLIPTPTPIVITPTPPVMPIIEEERLTHEEIEGILLELGNLLGFDTYTADKSKEYKGKTLGDLSTLREIPSFTYPRILETVKEVDVIWFKEDFPKYCFEVEHTTDVTKGLLRLFQIKELTSKFFIIAPSSRISKFETETRKDPFYRIKERYIFKSYKDLASLYDSAIKFYPLKTKFGIN